jgi:hypothetical protein
MIGEDVVARARAAVGARFRPQGRSVEEGLDCIGLAAFACAVPDARRDYAVSAWQTFEFEAGLEAAGFAKVDEAGAGDLLLVRAGPRQLHVLVLTGDGFVHADARLRRVVEVPGAVPWPAVSAWRQVEGQ